jgi:hypothetical protein
MTIKQNLSHRQFEFRRLLIRAAPKQRLVCNFLCGLHGVPPEMPALDPTNEKSSPGNVQANHCHNPNAMRNLPACFIATE